MSRRLLGALCALALAHAACNSSRAAPCPGERVGTFNFNSKPKSAVGTTGELGICSFAPSQVSFAATLTSDAGSNAYLCLDREEAHPLQGTRGADDSFDLEQQTATASVQGCACDVQVDEMLKGDLVVKPDGTTIFDGRLRNVVTFPSDAGSCGSESSASCGVPCEMVWEVEGDP